MLGNFYFILNVHLFRTLHPSFNSHVHAAFIRRTLALERNTIAALVFQRFTTKMFTIESFAFSISEI